MRGFLQPGKVQGYHTVLVKLPKCPAIQAHFLPVIMVH
jgi:hypothetical protein